MRSVTIFVILASLLAFSAGAQDRTTIPVLYVEQFVATPGPVSVYNVPDGSGEPLSSAFGPNGTVVDATITMTLFDDYPGWGQPVAHFPREDMWLEGGDGLLILCNGGTTADVNTDQNGVTTWATTLNVGGRADPDEGGDIFIVINGAVPDANGQVMDMRMNSADINGDGAVNLADIPPFAGDFYGPYAYRSDFVWDGLVNLSDLARLARAMGANCP